MMDIKELKVGDRVRHEPKYFIQGSMDGKPPMWENGIVKEIREGTDHCVWVVYHCEGLWDKYENYTGVGTNINDLKIGWRVDGEDSPPDEVSS